MVILFFDLLRRMVIVQFVNGNKYRFFYMADGSFLSVMNCHWIESCHVIYPICSMYGIFTYIYPTNGPNVDKYI